MQSLPLPLNNPAVPALGASANVAAGNLAVTGNLTANNLVVTGQSYIAIDQTTYEFWEDFTSHGITNALGAATTLAAEHGWTMQQIGANANCKVVTANPADGLHLGAIGFNANGTGTGNGTALFLGGGALAAGYINPNTQSFIYKAAFQISTTSTVSMFLGLTGNNAQATPANVNTAIALGIRYDTSVDGANLVFVGQTAGAVGNTWKDSGVAATTGWHHVVMTGYANGSVGFNLDGNATTAVVSTVPSALMDFGVVQMVTRATGSPQLNVDYVGMQVTGLNR
jgi:hypothetical protein